MSTNSKAPMLIGMVVFAIASIYSVVKIPTPPSAAPLPLDKAAAENLFSDEAIARRRERSRGFWKGMTTDEAFHSLGRPSEVNKTEGSWGVHEQWVYKKTPETGRAYLYFEDGILKSWQTTNQSTYEFEHFNP